MKFNLVDRIKSLEPGRRIVTLKSLARSEEYLADHFPTFPVMPGVLMVECMTQSAAWLVRATQGFTKSLVLLREAKNVTYKSFVAPGQVLEMTVECRQMRTDDSEFDGRGYCGDQEIVKARIILQHHNLADHDASKAAVDQALLAHARKEFALIGGDAAAQLAETT